STGTGNAVNNAGTFTRGGTGTTQFDNGVLLHNNGILNVTTGTLNLYGDGDSSGPINLSTGAEMTLSGGTFTFNSGAGISGAGVFRVNGGTIDDAADVSADNLTVSGGTLTGGADVTVNSVFTW